MGTWERDEEFYCPCPCGNGSVVEVTETPDNGWSRTNKWLSLECRACSDIWTLNGQRLVHKAQRALYWAAHQEAEKLGTTVRAELDAVVDAFVSAAGFLSYKSEWQHLNPICNEGPIKYKRGREAGKKASSLCHSMANVDWILNTMEHSNAVEDLLASYKRALSSAARLEKNIQNIVLGKSA